MEHLEDQVEFGLDECLGQRSQYALFIWFWPTLYLILSAFKMKVIHNLYVMTLKTSKLGQPWDLIPTWQLISRGDVPVR